MSETTAQHIVHDVTPPEPGPIDYGMTVFDAEKVAEAFRAQGYHDVEVRPSAIQGSPHNYVYVFLTEDAEEGPHVCISEGAEHIPHESAWCVGGYEHWEKPAVQGPDDCYSLSEALQLAGKFYTDSGIRGNV